MTFINHTRYIIIILNSVADARPAICRAPLKKTTNLYGEVPTFLTITL